MSSIVISEHPPSSVRQNYEQIDTIRIITICFIIWGHCLLTWEKQVPLNTLDHLLTVAIFQSGKISTIIFFVVAGFLVRAKLPQYTVKSYFLDRIPKVYFPWVLFMFIFLLLNILQVMPIIKIWNEGNIRLFKTGVYNNIVGVLFYTAYWFITVYAISMGLIVALRRHAEKMWLGALLGAITVFYCINLYYQLIPPNHGKAFLGYAFYVWLGIQANKHFESIKIFIKKISWPVMILVLVFLFILACLEARFLTRIGCLDAYASNRFSNSLFSLSFFMALLKMGANASLNKLQPRKMVYGMFLVHNLIIFELSFLINAYLLKYLYINIWIHLIIQLVFFMTILFITYILVNIISNSKYRWLIGLASPKKGIYHMDKVI